MPDEILKLGGAMREIPLVDGQAAPPGKVHTALLAAGWQVADDAGGGYMRDVPTMPGFKVYIDDGCGCELAPDGDDVEPWAAVLVEPTHKEPVFDGAPGRVRYIDSLVPMGLPATFAQPAVIHTMLLAAANLARHGAGLPPITSYECDECSATVTA